MHGRIIVILATLAVVAWLLAAGASALLGAAIEPPPRTREGTAPSATVRADRTALGCAILARNAFDSATGSIDCDGEDVAVVVPPPPPPSEPGSCGRSLRLVATYVERRRDRSRIALIRDASGAGLLYAPGMSLGEHVIEAIDPERVLLRSNDLSCTIALFERGPPQELAAVAPEPPRVVGDRVRIPADLVARAIADPMSVAGTLRAVPVPDGLRLQGIAREHPLASLGVRSGDVVRSVDGLALGDPDAWLGALAAIQRPGAHAIELSRRGQPISIAVDVDP